MSGVGGHEEFIFVCVCMYACVRRMGRRRVDYCSIGGADDGGQTRIIWLIYWGSEAGTFAGEPPDYLAIIKVRASLLPPMYTLLLPH